MKINLNLTLPEVNTILSVLLLGAHDPLALPHGMAAECAALKQKLVKQMALQVTK